MFFNEPADSRPFSMPILRQGVVLAGLALVTVYLGLFWNSLAGITERSSQILF
jgi:hypothetical protein